MMYIGKDVQVIDQVTGQKRSACLADESHCAIIISYSGQTREMVEVAEIYHKRNIQHKSIIKRNKQGIVVKWFVSK